MSKAGCASPSRSRRGRGVHCVCVFRAEGCGQTSGGGLKDFGLRLLRLAVLAPDRTGNAKRTDNPAGEVAYRHGDAAHLEIEFALVERNPGASYLGDFTKQRRYFCDRVLG